MGEERIELSARERERLKLLHEIQQGHLSQVEASGRLRLSTRQVRRLERRVEAEGDHGVVHRLRGRPSNRKISPSRRESPGRGCGLGMAISGRRGRPISWLLRR